MPQKLSRQPSRRQQSYEDLGAAIESSKQYALKMLGLPGLSRRKSTSSWNRDPAASRQEQHRRGHSNHDDNAPPKKRPGHMPRLSFKFGPSRSPPLSFPAGLGEYFFPERRTSKLPASSSRNVHSPTPSCPETRIDTHRIPVRRSSVSSANMLDWMPSSRGHRASRSESTRYPRDREPPPQYPGPPQRTTSVVSTPVPGYHSAGSPPSTVDTSYPSFLPPIQARTSSLYHCRGHASRKSQHSLDEIMMGHNRPTLRPSRSNSSPWNLESAATTPTLLDSPDHNAAALSPARPATSTGVGSSSKQSSRPSSSARTTCSARFQPFDARSSRISRASTSGSSNWDSATCRDSITTDGLRYSLSSSMMSEMTASSGLGISMPIPESPSIPAFPVPPKSPPSKAVARGMASFAALDEPKRRSLAQRRRLPGGLPKRLDPPQYLPPPPKQHRRSEDDGMTSMDSPVLGWFPSTRPVRSSSCPPRPDDADGKARKVRPAGVEPDPSPNWAVSPRSSAWATSPIMVVADIEPTSEARSPWAISPIMVVAQFEPDCDEVRTVQGNAAEAGPPAVPRRSPQRPVSPGLEELGFVM